MSGRTKTELYVSSGISTSKRHEAKRKLQPKTYSILFSPWSGRGTRSSRGVKVIASVAFVVSVLVVSCCHFLGAMAWISEVKAAITEPNRTDSSST